MVPSTNCPDVELINFKLQKRLIVLADLSTVCKWTGECSIGVAAIARSQTRGKSGHPLGWHTLFKRYHACVC